jgi:hypothetical protein
MDEMTHDRCSELLGPYVRGELPPDDAAEVRAHLDGCDDCRLEERAIAALVEETPLLDDVERARLHRALTQELGTAPANADVAAPVAGAPTWTRWIGPAAGAAAAVAALAFFALGGLTGGSDDTAEGGSGQLRVGAPAREEDTFEGAGGAGGGSAADAVEAAEPEPQRGELETAALGGRSTDPVFDRDAESLDADHLADTGRAGDPFTSFASTYSVEEGEGLRDEQLARLARAAGAAAPDVRACARTMPDDPTVVAVYGATGDYGGRDALVLGFVTTESGERFDRYLMWVWARGECEQPIDTLIGDIEG